MSPPTQRQLYLRIVRCFADEPSPAAPLSLHAMLTAGRPHGVTAGEWLGPFKLCLALGALVRLLEAPEQQQVAGNRRAVERAEEAQGGGRGEPPAADACMGDVPVGVMGRESIQHSAVDPQVEDREAVEAASVHSPCGARRREGETGREREVHADEMPTGDDTAVERDPTGDEVETGGSLSTPREESFVQVGRHEGKELSAEQGGSMLAGIRVHVVGVDPRDESGGIPVLYVDDVAQLCRLPGRETQQSCTGPATRHYAEAVDQVHRVAAGVADGRESDATSADLHTAAQSGGERGEQGGGEGEGWEGLLKGDEGEWCAVVVLVPLVLGVDNINPRWVGGRVGG